MFDYGDVARAATSWDEWQKLERSLAEDLVRVAESGEQEEHIDLDGAVVSFRRARRLVSGADYRRWLEVRSLTTADVDAHLLRAALRARAPIASCTGPSPEAVVWVEAILSGALRQWAGRLAACCAAEQWLAAAAGEPHASAPPGNVSPEDRAARIDALVHAEREFRARVTSRQRIEHCLAQHRLDWQRVAWRELVFGSEGAAREAAMLVREDGLGLDEVASLAHATLNSREAYSSDVPQLAATLMSATPGQLVGPIRGDGCWRAVALTEWTPPHYGDDRLRARASEELSTEALERHLAGRVRWHVEL